MEEAVDHVQKTEELKEAIHQLRVETDKVLREIDNATKTIESAITEAEEGLGSNSTATTDSAIAITAAEEGLGNNSAATTKNSTRVTREAAPEPEPFLPFLPFASFGVALITGGLLDEIVKWL